MIGAYTINYNVFDVLVMIIFGFIGYFLRKFEYEEAPLVLAFVLGPLLEKAFCQTMIIANGDFSIFFRRPISATLLLLAAGLLISNALGIVRAGRRKMADQLEA
jgi:putative tricarboxylic transport membrane protein